MAILSSLAQSMAPETVGKLASAMGLNASQAQQGMSIVGPLLLGSLAQKSQTTSGLDSIMHMLPDDSGGSVLGKLLGTTAGPLAAASALTGVLGPGVSSIGKALSGRLGFNVSPLLVSAAPAMLGAISKTAKEQKLNSTDIASLLQKENTESLASAAPEVKSVVDEAFKVRDKAEQLKSRFTDDEWRGIRLAPVAVTTYVVTASPSGITGLAKEIIASGRTLQAIVKDALPTSLTDVAYGSVPTMQELDADGGLDKNAPRESMLLALKSTVTAVKAKSPADARSFSDALVGLGRKVAEASKEGGFLGIGGTLVSKEEEQAIAEIAAAVA
jgi:Bacterial protein of unknown function (DUF937)